ncbi:uncharacterized protein LOC126272603 [Schistocerca gregaria]|uniref:uncharacterized protein LOC126272603 n=1 Tax=Schistocerca gregaria TaxID=7010 RepID=UPI00211DD73E|nr:uncharacterized protein LOC126272603 [Schistocerca gregaria]
MWSHKTPKQQVVKQQFTMELKRFPAEKMTTINPKNIQHNKLTLKYSFKLPGCSSGYYMGSAEEVSNKHFYRFPKQPRVLLLKWKSVCKLSSVVNCATYFVCEDHSFKDFMNKTKRRLNRAVFLKRGRCSL